MRFWCLYCVFVTASMVFLCQAEANCSGRITISVSSNDTVEVPVVSEVVFQLYFSNNATFNVTSPTALIQEKTGDNLTITNSSGFRQDLTVQVRNISGDNDDTILYEVTVTFVEDAITCSNIILSRNVSNNPFSFTCNPISSCNSESPVFISSVTWQRRTDDEFTTLATNGTSMNSEPDVITINTTDGGVTNNTLSISRLTYASAAFYEVWSDDNNDNSTRLHAFTLYYTPVSARSSHDTSTDNGYMDFSIDCTFTTFPNATVTWNYSSTINGDSVGLKEGIEFSDTNATINGRSINGRLTFERVVYEDAGFYNCMADNGFGQAVQQVRLRVKNPIRAVYPVVGIVSSFIVTGIFIIAGSLIRKYIIGEKESTIDQADYDVAFTRPQSIASEDDVQIATRRVSNRRSLQPLVSKDSTLST